MQALKEQRTIISAFFKAPTSFSNCFKKSGPLGTFFASGICFDLKLFGDGTSMR